MKYKCVNCGHVFQAESSTTNTCPVCGSINVAVQPASNKPYLIMLAVFCLLIIGCLVLLFLPSKDDKKDAIAKNDEKAKVEQTVQEPVEQSDDAKIEGVVIDPITEGEDATTTDKVGAPIKIQSIKVVNKPQYNSANKTWSFAVVAQLNNAGMGAPVVYEVIDAKGKRVTSDNGQFRNVAIAQPIITVIAKLKDDESVNSFVDVEGFNVKDTPAITDGGGAARNKVTIAEVQSWINDPNAKSNPLLDTKGNTRVSPKCKYTITGLNSEDANSGLSHPRADKILEKIEFKEWSSLTVEDIQCDPKTGMLTSVTARVNY